MSSSSTLPVKLKRLLNQARNGSVDALRSLVPAVETDVNVLIEVMPVILLNIPDMSHPILSSQPDENVEPDDTTRLVYAAIRVLSRGLNGYRFETDARLHFMHRWPDVSAWCSFISANYIERPTYFVGADEFKDEARLIIHILLWVLTTPTAGTASTVIETNGSASLMARMYLAAVHAPNSPDSDGMIYAFHMQRNLSRQPISTWIPEWRSALDEAHPSTADVALNLVTRATAKRPIPWYTLHSGVSILTTIFGTPRLARALVQKNSVRCICRAMHLTAVSPRLLELDTKEVSTSILGLCSEYLQRIILYDGLKSVVQALDYRVLSSILRSMALIDERTNETTTLQKPYEDLLEVILLYTVYYSVHSSLDRAVSRIEKDNLQALVVGSSFEKKWLEFVTLAKRRLRTKKLVDIHPLTLRFCANRTGTCPHSKIKVTCAGCKKVHYCDRQCQKSHWKIHRGFCQWTQMQQEQRPSHPIDDRNAYFVSLIILLDIQKDQEQLLQAQKKYREDHRDLPSDEFLISLLDYRYYPPMKRVITVDEAKKSEPDRDWDKFIQDAKGKREEELPLIVGLYRNGLVTESWVGFYVKT